ncbi:hypothetical protein JCM5353_007366 [Sporobolomyces roseus]
MSSLFAEPVSPILEWNEEDEPELDGLRNLSVSTDGTLDSLDENPTPPQSPNPNPIVHITPPGARFPTDSDSLAFEHSIFRSKLSINTDKIATQESVDPLCTTFARPPSPLNFLPSLPSYSDIPPTPDAVKIAFPALPFPPVSPPSETLAERRASAGKLPNRAFLSLMQMKFEASEDAGMGLGVGPPSAGFDGMEDVGLAQAGKVFQLAMETDKRDEESDGRHQEPSTSPLLAAPGIGNEGGRTLRRSGSTGSLRPSRSRSPLRSTRPYSFHATESPSRSPSLHCPASPLVKRSSAFSSSNNGPLTPLTPSHIPGAPSLSNSSSAFEWFSYSIPNSPGFPSRPVSPAPPQFDSSSLTLPLTPTSDSGSITPTGRTHFSQKSMKIPSSPLGRGRFSEEETKIPSNPFFA